MGKQQKQNARRARVRRGIRARISGTAERPRISIYRSNKHIYAQVIDDLEGRTIVAASSLEKGVSGGNPIEVATSVGKLVGERIKESGIDNVVFDRNGYRYHGRIKGVADGLRESGIQV